MVIYVNRAGYDGDTCSDKNKGMLSGSYQSVPSTEAPALPQVSARMFCTRGDTRSCYILLAQFVVYEDSVAPTHSPTVGVVSTN